MLCKHTRFFRLVMVLVSQIPSIIVSIAAGILVTRSSEEANLGEFVGKQLVIYPKAVAISGVLLLAFLFSFRNFLAIFYTLSMACFACCIFSLQKSEEPEPVSCQAVN